MSVQTSPTRSPEEIRELCRLRRFLLVVFLLEILGFVLGRILVANERNIPAGAGLLAWLMALFVLLILVASVVMLVLSVYVGFRLARALGRKIPGSVMYAFLMFLGGIFGLIAYLTLAREVTRVEAARKSQPQPTSANQDDPDRLKDQAASQDAAATDDSSGAGNAQ